jgi:hypothetical protein
MKSAAHAPLMTFAVMTPGMPFRFFFSVVKKINTLQAWLIQVLARSLCHPGYGFLSSR